MTYLTTLTTWITDPNEDAPNISVYAVSHSLLIFFTSRCQPIITDELFNHCLEYSPDLDKTILPSQPFYHKKISKKVFLVLDLT